MSNENQVDKKQVWNSPTIEVLDVAKTATGTEVGGDGITAEVKVS